MLTYRKIGPRLLRVSRACLSRMYALGLAWRLTGKEAYAEKAVENLLASTPNALIMETYPGTKSQYNPALPLFPIKDGYITVPDKPGLGIDPDPADINKYRVD